MPSFPRPHAVTPQEKYQKYQRVPERTKITKNEFKKYQTALNRDAILP